MAVVPKQQGQLVPINQCKGFKEDPAFEKARGSMAQTGTAVDMVNRIIQPTNQNTLQGSVRASMDCVNFHDDRFELIVDARGYSPQDIKCCITNGTVEVQAEMHEQQGNAQRTMTMSRTYQLPQTVSPEMGNCSLSAEGVLVISVPWRT